MLWASYFYEVLSPPSQMMSLSSWMGSELLNVVVVRQQMLRLRSELSSARVQMHVPCRDATLPILALSLLRT